VKRQVLKSGDALNFVRLPNRWAKLPCFENYRRGGKETMRDKLISAGIRNLKSFGYSHVDSKNIITDLVYGMFFDNMLKDNLGKGVDEAINSLRAEIAAAQKPADSTATSPNKRVTARKPRPKSPRATS
jgi:hypothetical protein